MSRTRSPNYPAIGLGEAIKKAKAIWEKEHHSKFSRVVAAKALGYTGLNGVSIVLISALLKYGILEGRGDDLKLSSDALSMLHDGRDSESRKKVLLKAALTPELFKELSAEYGEHLPSEDNLQSYLLKRGFIPSAAGAATRAYLETMALVVEHAGDYNEPQEPSEVPIGGSPMQSPAPSAQGSQPSIRGVSPPVPLATGSGGGQGVLWLQVPFRGSTLTVRIDAGGETLTKEHVARVRKYLQLAESDLGGEEGLED